MIHLKGGSFMEIGKKLKETRLKCNLTQEQVSEMLYVSRQTISNWENEKSYPDIISIIKLSDLYSISLDELLKGDEKMIEHLEESTNIVESNTRLIVAIAINIVLLLVLFIIASVLPNNRYLLAATFTIAVVAISFLLYQIVRKI
jgi:transcriptional regulator with XRE-family HTH domain